MHHFKYLLDFFYKCKNDAAPFYIARPVSTDVSEEEV
jgi:hypothetical protein